MATADKHRTLKGSDSMKAFLASLAVVIPVLGIITLTAVEAYPTAHARHQREYNSRRAEDLARFEEFANAVDNDLAVTYLGGGVYSLPLLVTYEMRFNHKGLEKYDNLKISVRGLATGGGYWRHEFHVTESGIIDRFKVRHPGLEVVDVRRDDHDDYIVRTRRVVRG